MELDEQSTFQARVARMISIDWSILPAIVIFILTILALNHLLFKPVIRVQGEREMRTAGMMSQIRRDMEQQLQLFDQYQATIKNARMEGYRVVEKARSKALHHRGATLDIARRAAEQLTAEARDAIGVQVADAKIRLEREAHEIARRIASAILQRPA